MTQVDFDFHLVVAPDNPDNIADVVLEKVELLRPALVVAATHGKSGFTVSELPLSQATGY